MMVHAGYFQRVVRVGSPAGSGIEDGSGLYKAEKPVRDQLQFFR